jgi:hypothetical protein
MERKFYTDDFEQLLKDRTDDFRMYPSKRVWHSIYNEMHPGRRWPSIAVSMVLVIVLLMLGYWNSNSSSTKTIVAASSSLKNTENNNALNATTDNFPTDYSGIAMGSNQNSIQPDIAKVNSTMANNIAVNGNNTITFTNPAVKNIVATPHINATVNKSLPQNINNSAFVNTTTGIKNIQPVNASNLPAGNDNSVNDDAATTISNNTITGIAELNRVIITAPVVTDANNGAETILINDVAVAKENNVVTPVTKKTMAAEDKAWIEDYAFHNKSKRKKWHDRTASVIYFTPGIGYRNFSSNFSSAASIVNAFAGAPASGSVDDVVNQKPGLGLEIGVGIVYSAAKNIRFKAGVQANYTNYVINANETNHPTSTNIMLNDLNSGLPYMESRSSTLSNISGYKTTKVHNTTYQLSLPIGFALKLAGNNNLEWYTGATVQPTFVFGGNANLLSFDRNSYVKDPSLIRQWNVNAGIETYIHYKFAGSTLQIGPQFRYQLGSTYSKKYTLTENLYNIGIKVGVLKNF